MARAQASDVIPVGPWGRETSSSNGTFLIPISSNFKWINVGHGAVIDSLNFTIQGTSGEEEEVKFGGDGSVSNVVKVEFVPGEYITTISGAYGYVQSQQGIYVTAIAFTTNLGTTYGPYGHMEGYEKFSSPAGENNKISGFFAYLDNSIQNIGIYVRPILSTDT